MATRKSPRRITARPAKQSGYTDCACRDCFEIAVSSDVSHPEMCHACRDAGCEPDRECRAPGAYGTDFETMDAVAFWLKPLVVPS